MHKAFHIGYLAIIALLLILFVIPERPEPVHSPEPPARNMPETAMPAEEAVDNRTPARESRMAESDLHRELAELRAQVEQLEGELQNERAKALPELPDSPNHPGSAQEYVPGDVKNLESQFQREHRDPEWAYAEEDRVTDLFYTHNALSDFQLEQVECRETTCRLLVQLDEADNNAREVLHSVLKEALDYRNSSAYFNRTSQRIQLIFERPNDD